MKNRIWAFIMALPALTLLFTACNKNDSNNSGTAKMTVMLTDAPANYDAVNVDIQDVQVNATSSDNGWQSIHLLRPGVYNLLNFRNGIDTVLASQDLPAGDISQIRLILGSNNTVVIKGTSYPLATPSAQQSGLKLNVHASLTAGIEYRLWLDFDANRSVVTTGNNNYILKPVIRTYTQATSGSIKGIALPLLHVSGVYAIQNADTIAAAKPDALTGAYLLPGLNAGAYNVAIAGDGTVKDTLVTNVNVSTGQVTTVNAITLHL
ncbi:DUF4382 domain-containing protein [Chitinophaga qingshengii]|uniref:DUF4382 domain-containing protein n=1 Tax=Chitinophaga qingshengii TaxID=1569794 RepID=A0ABR7TL59_9BACT|nr:DUF4382 domain-containing protein [Chitinophaga qingshengii]MBC9930693.1 DUF4382 domain-containing protein [Chitinophaga qingshengii]